MKSFSLLLLTLSVLTTGSLHAGITFFAPTHQTTPPPGVTFTATGGALAYGVKELTIGVVGVEGPGQNVEINEGQSLILTFDTPHYFNYLTLALLFDGDEFDDQGEIAGVTINGLPITYTLMPTSDTTAAWTGAGTVDNLSPATLGSGGVWRINQPFGNQAVSSLVLSPLPTLGSGSDFGLMAFGTAAQSVPDSASPFALLLTSLVGLSWLARRRR